MCDCNIIKQVWCTVQTILITHVYTRLLLTHNESLCVHQPVEMVNAALFSCAGYLARKQSVTLCLLSTAALTDTGERPSLLARSSHYPDSCWDTSSPQTVHELHSNTHLHSWSHANASFHSRVRDCALEQQSHFHQYGDIEGCLLRCSLVHPHKRAHTKPSLHLTPDSR